MILPYKSKIVFVNKIHYSDVTMSTMPSQITSRTIVYSIIFSVADHRKHQSSAPLALVRGIHRSPVNSAHKWPMKREMLPLVIMRHLWKALWSSWLCKCLYPENSFNNQFNVMFFVTACMYFHNIFIRTILGVNVCCYGFHCPACRTYEIATRFWVVVICPIIKCLTVSEFSFILFDLCLFITIFNFILNYVLIVTFWIFTYHKIWILLIIYCFIWNYWIIYFLRCLEVFWSVVS